MLLVRMLTRSIFEIKTKEPVETDGLFPYLLSLTSYFIPLTSYPMLSISSDAQMNGPTPLASLSRMGSER